MGHEQSRAPQIRGNYDFSTNNLDSVFEVGYDEQISINDILSTLVFDNISQKNSRMTLPSESMLINIILSSNVFTRSNSSKDVWHDILSPLFIGSTESLPYIQQLLSSFFQSLKDRSNNIYEKERAARAAIQNKLNDEKRTIITLHNPKEKIRFEIKDSDLSRMKSQNDIIKFIISFINQYVKTVFFPNIRYFPLSEIICNFLRKSPKTQFAYITFKWGIAAADLSPLIDGFVQLIKNAIYEEPNPKKINFNLQSLSNELPNVPLTNSTYVPSAASLIGTSVLPKVELSAHSSTSSLYSDGKNLYFLGRRATLIIVSLSKNIPKIIQRTKIVELKVSEKDKNSLCLSGSNNFLIITSKSTSLMIMFKLNPLVRISKMPTYQSNNFFSTPKLKHPYVSDGKFIYCVDSTKRISIFVIENSLFIKFQRYIDFQSSNAPLIVPYDRALVPKEWLNQSAIFSNGVVFSFLVLRRADHANFSYFMRHFSLVDGSHISDISLSLKWPILSLSVDPWNNCVWAISPNNNEVTILKMNLTCSSPPWFTGSGSYPPPQFSTVVHTLTDTDSLESATVGICNFLNFYSYHFFDLSFRGCINNPQYNVNIAHAFAPCTNEAIHSLINGINYFIKIFIDMNTTKIIASNKVKNGLVSLIRLLQYNLMNFETRIIDESRHKVILLDSAKEIIDTLVSILNNAALSFVHRLVCFIFVSCFSNIFKNDRSYCSKVFSIIYSLMPDDFIFYMLQQLHYSPLFPYCFSPSLTKIILSPIFKSYAISAPNQLELISIFHRNIMYEMYFIYSTSPIDIDDNNNDNLAIQDTFYEFISLMLEQMSSFLSSLSSNYNEYSLQRSSFFIFFSKWIILFQPFSNFSRVSSTMASMLKPLYLSMTSKINEFQLDSPIRKDKKGFHTIFLLFFEIFSVYVDSIVSLLDGGSELSDTTRYSWLIRPTISSQITLSKIDEVMTSVFKNKSVSEDAKKMLKKGLSFNIFQEKNFLKKIREDEFLTSIISMNESETINSLFNFLYETVPNRFSKKLTDSERHFERIVFAAFMKQLGLFQEVLYLQENLKSSLKRKKNFNSKIVQINDDNDDADDDNDNDTTSDESKKNNTKNRGPVITHYTKQIMEALYRVRMLLKMSKQATKQLEVDQQNDLVTPASESLKQNFKKYREEIIRKCIFLLHIEPCLRFQWESFEKAFPDFLKRIQKFMVSEISLDQYIILISTSERSRLNVALGLELINDILMSNCEEFCKYYLIEKLASSSNFLTFLTAVSDDSFNDAAKSCISTIEALLKLLNNLMKSNNCLNTQVVFYLNLILMIKKVEGNLIFESISNLISTISSLKNSISENNYKSYMAFIATTLYTLYMNDKNIFKKVEFQRLIKSIFPSDTLTEKNLSIAQICFRMNTPILFTIQDVINLFTKLQPEFYYSAGNLLCDLLIQNPTCEDYYIWILTEISHICSGMNSSLMSSFSLVTECDPLKYSTVKTPGALLNGAATLIYICRSILQKEGTTACRYMNEIFEDILSTTEEDSHLNKKVLLFGVFAVLSNSINVTGVNTLISHPGTNNIYFIDSKNDNGYLCWQLPIEGRSVLNEVRDTSSLKPIPFIPFTTQMFTNVNLLIPYFVKYLFSKKDSVSDEALSFYVLSSLKEYINNHDFLVKIINQILQYPIRQISFGDSSNDFLYLLKKHLLLNSDGFFSPSIPLSSEKTCFYDVSYLTSNTRRFCSINQTTLKSNAGINLFLSNILRYDTNISLTLTLPSSNTTFDAGLYMPSMQQNHCKAVMIKSQNNGAEAFLMNSQQETIKLSHISHTITIKYFPSIKQAIITNTETNDIMKMQFSAPDAVFFVVLYQNSSINFSFSDNDATISRSSLNLLQNHSNLPSLTDEKDNPLNTKKITFGMPPSNEIIEYINPGIEHSLQTITISIMGLEPPKYASVPFKESSYLGFPIPPNLLFQNPKDSLISMIFKARPCHSISSSSSGTLTPSIISKKVGSLKQFSYRNQRSNTNLNSNNKLSSNFITIPNRPVLIAPKGVHQIPMVSSLRSTTSTSLISPPPQQQNGSDSNSSKTGDSDNDNIANDASTEIINTPDIDVGVVDDSTGHVSRINSCNFKSMDFLPPFHMTTLGTIPSMHLNYFISSIIPDIRKQTYNTIVVRCLSTPSLNINNIIESCFTDLSSLLRFLVSILAYVEPFSPFEIMQNKTPINFSYNTLDGNSLCKSSLSFYNVALQRIISYFQETNLIKNVIQQWLDELTVKFKNGYSHSVSLDYQFAVIIPLSEESTHSPIHFSDKNASFWMILQSGFGDITAQDFGLDVTFNNPNDDSEINFSNNTGIICIKGSTVDGKITISQSGSQNAANSKYFYSNLQSKNASNNQKSIIAIPCFNNNESLFGTFFDLVVSFKYFVLFFKSKMSLLTNDHVKSIKFTLYSLFFDSFNARSPFFITFGHDILQFMQFNLPILTSDLTDQFIYKLSILSVYTPADEYPFIHQFIEDQQNVLDEVFIFGTQDIFSEIEYASTTIMIDKYEESLTSSTASSYLVNNSKNSNHSANSSSNTNSTTSSPSRSKSNRPKTADSPFPDTISADDNLPKLISNVKRILVKRKDIHSCPFHLLLHRWALYSHRYPSTVLKIIKPNVAHIHFSFYVPKSFHFVFYVMPETIRLCIAYNDSFNNARYFAPDSSISPKGHSEIYVMIVDDDEVGFASLQFYIESEDQYVIDDFIKNYKTQFVLDAKSFFIHWNVKNDQNLLRCFPSKPYYRHTMSLQFDPMRISFAHLNYPMSILCCRVYFLMILNFYYTKSRSDFSKDTTLHSFLPSILMKIKIDKFRKLFSHSDEKEGDFIRINRKAAFEVRDGQSKNLNMTLISQLSEAYTSPVKFRIAGDMPWKVHLIGEQGCDVGGLARELVTEAAIDLTTPTCGLVVPIPNAVNGYGNDTNLVIPIPNQRHQNILKQYNFAGALIGIAIRSGLTQEFNFPPLVWEYLMTGSFSIERIFEIDHNFQSLITSLKQVMKTVTIGGSFANGISTSMSFVSPKIGHPLTSPDPQSEDSQESPNGTNDFKDFPIPSSASVSSKIIPKGNNNNSNASTLNSNFKFLSNSSLNSTAEAAIDRFNLRFVVQTSTGSEALLTQRGFDEMVTLSNVESYIAMATEFRLNEMKEYLDAMSHGLWENLDMKPPKYLDWQTLEYAACGEKEIPISSLKKMVTFIEVPDDQQEIFWDVLEHFTVEQRSLFLKFSTGRVKLPNQTSSSGASASSNGNPSQESFLTVEFTFGEVDKMPTASTCFNQLHIPRYTSFEKAYRLMSLAIEYTGTFEIG